MDQTLSQVVRMDIFKHLIDDTVFNKINKQFISLDDNEVKKQNVYVQEVVDSFIESMKHSNEFFLKYFKRIVFSGSFYKGTKVAHPYEFDLNLVIALPVEYQPLLIDDNVPGYVKIRTGKAAGLNLNTTDELTRTILSFLDNTETLNTAKFRSWMERVICKTLNTLEKKKHNTYLLPVKNRRIYEIAIRKSGPAFTLSFETNEGANIDIDLVPVLEFKEPLTKHKEKLSIFTEKNWYAVPKPLVKDIPNRDWYWRLSFADQEKVLLGRNGQIKPVIRQMKVLRRLHNACEQRKINYFWDCKVNLLENIHPDTIKIITNRLSKIIQDVEKFISIDPFVVAKYILTTSDFNKLQAQSFVQENDDGHELLTNLTINS